MTNFDTSNNISSMEYTLKSVPGLADVGVPHGDGDGPRTPPRCMEGVWKKFQVTNFNMPNKVSFIKNGEDGPRTLAPGSGSKITAYHVVSVPLQRKN